MEAAVEELKEIGNSPEEIRAYNNRMLALSDIATQTHASEEIGMAKGEARGIALAKKVFKLAKQGKSSAEIANACEITAEMVEQILE